MKKFRSVLFLAVLFSVLAVWMPFNIAAQNVATSQDSTITDVDGAFMQARQLAFDGEREEARELAYAILEVPPEYLDVRILVARTYSWDGRYEEARRELDVDAASLHHADVRGVGTVLESDAAPLLRRCRYLSGVAGRNRLLARRSPAATEFERILPDPQSVRGARRAKTGD